MGRLSDLWPIQGWGCWESDQWPDFKACARSDGLSEDRRQAHASAVALENFRGWLSFSHGGSTLVLNSLLLKTVWLPSVPLTQEKNLDFIRLSLRLSEMQNKLRARLSLSLDRSKRWTPGGWSHMLPIPSKCFMIDRGKNEWVNLPSVKQPVRASHPSGLASNTTPLTTRWLIFKHFWPQHTAGNTFYPEAQPTQTHT